MNSNLGEKIRSMNNNLGAVIIAVVLAIPFVTALAHGEMPLM